MQVKRQSLVSDYFKIRLEVKGIRSRELTCLTIPEEFRTKHWLRFYSIWIQKDIWGHPRLDVFKTSLEFHWLHFRLSLISKAMNSTPENNPQTDQTSFLYDNYCMGNYLSAGIKLFNPNWCNEHLLILCSSSSWWKMNATQDGYKSCDTAEAETVPRWMCAIIKVKGGQTKYFNIQFQFLYTTVFLLVATFFGWQCISKWKHVQSDSVWSSIAPTGTPWLTLLYGREPSPCPGAGGWLISTFKIRLKPFHFLSVILQLQSLVWLQKGSTEDKQKQYRNQSTVLNN